MGIVKGGGRRKGMKEGKNERKKGEIRRGEWEGKGREGKGRR